ncbi:class I SAM-dependent methyltransferase [Chitiniphilus purpureus]|uniref:Class I SAM-dependent methyltransferase n=1 Tax=Chitiniphilus purpureus TaxID=2981137 RepID=A0ABY6DML5_9NEIS|nr:class I SAM-dependent methyltransferase [Chitiniphilus sp. CD1]UXY15615.1 class I SAM-dependent methyltransferase [Chitiniphilus sp. CD1]
MNLDDYLACFGDPSRLERARLLQELDAAWEQYGLDNRQPLNQQADKVAAYYSHPCWVLNGLFSGADPISRGHREKMADWIAEQRPMRIADFGGGSGVLASLLIQRLPGASVEIVEPYPAEIFQRQLSGQNQVRFVPQLEGQYDVVVAQDVLEHVDDPLALASRLIAATRPGGLLIFANCFYPDIKCHLPATFYLRHTFSWILQQAGLQLQGTVPGVPHAQIFRYTVQFDPARLLQAGRLAQAVGPVINLMAGLIKVLRRKLIRHPS